MARPIKRLRASSEVAQELRRRVWASTSTVREKRRAEIVLLRLDGIGVTEVAAQLKTTAKCVSKWSRRFEAQGLDGLEDAPGRGRKPSIPTKKVDEAKARASGCDDYVRKPYSPVALLRLLRRYLGEER
jgi:transposase